MKTINEYVNEARKITYRVSMVDFKDEEGLPITVEMSVEPQYQKKFEKFLEDSQDNIFIHAEGGNVEF